MARIGTATHLLRDSALSVKEIAHICGFPSESGFCIAFKGMVGMPPLAYRKA
jgi:AraC-like DNA-binding protein